MRHQVRVSMRSTRTITTRVGIVLGLVVAASGAWLMRPRLDRDPSTPASPPVAHADQGVLAQRFKALFAYGLKAGKAYNYTFQQNTAVLRDGEPYAGISGSGTLEAHVVDVGLDSIDLIARVAYAAQSDGGGSLLAKPTQLRVDGTAYLRLARNGRVKLLRFLPALEKSPQERLITSAVASWLYVLPRFEASPAVPGAANAGPYPAEASDPQGDYSAEYRVVGGFTNPLELTMRKLNYTRASALTRIARSEHHVRWNLLDGYLLHAVSDDRYHKGASQLNVESRERTEISFTSITDAQFTVADIARYTLESAMYVAPQPAKQPDSAVGDQPAQSWSELQSELRTLPNDPESEKPLEVFGALATSLVKHPEMLPAVLAEARAQPSSSDQFKMLLGAIGNLGSPAAQRGLIELFGTTDERGKHLVIKTQALMNAPSTRETREMLASTYDNAPSARLKSEAGLALGSALKNQPGDDPSLSSVRARIRKMWSDATTASEKEFVLDMIGNSGDPSFLDILSAEFQNPASLHRAQALDAMRFMNDEESASLLFYALTLSDLPTLQTAALDALVYHGWKPEFFEPLASCFLKPIATDIRIGCARVILRQPSAQQQMRPLLQRVASSNDLDTELRAFVEGELKA